MEISIKAWGWTKVERSLFTDQEWFNPELIYEEEEDDDDFSGPEFTWDV